jgi:TonB family protein
MMAKRESIPSAKRRKRPALLVTHDDELWPRIGAHLNDELFLKQVDSIDELLAATQSDEPAIVFWDARGHAEPATVLSRLQLHSARFAIIVLDAAGSAASWTLAIQHRQIVSVVAVPVVAEKLTAAVAGAQEELNARIALLGAGTAASEASSPASPRIPWITAVSLGGVLIACATAFIYFRHDDAAVKSAPAANTTAGAEEKVDALVEKAQRAMLDRHYIEPTEGSALSLYRAALILDPASGEARQGLQRLAGILIARVQSALDEKKFDVALQALETARSIDPSDYRLAALDERIAGLQAELGPAEIQAAINAANFDRAEQLLDEAAGAKFLGGAKLSQLRVELRRRRAEVDIARFVALIDARLKQDRLIDPPNDSAAYYLDQARQAGASASEIQPQYQDLLKRIARAVHGAIDQHRFDDADRFLAELHSVGAPLATISGLQRDLGAARTQQTREIPDQPQFLDLARSRLAQGHVLEPEDDSALFYVNQLRTVDPHNSGLTQITGDVQAQILERAREALDAADLTKGEALLQAASGLGSSADLDSLSERLRLAKPAANGLPEEVPEGTLIRVRKLEIEYPRTATSRKIEGAVDIGYTVTSKGSVTDVKILDSSPPGIFEAAASRAVSRLRYKPVMQGGKAVAVLTKLRVTFRIAS